MFDFENTKDIAKLHEYLMGKAVKTFTCKYCGKEFYLDDEDDDEDDDDDEDEEDEE